MQRCSSQHVWLVVDSFDFSVIVENVRIEKLVRQLLFTPELCREIRDRQNATAILEEWIVWTILFLLTLLTRFRRNVFQISSECEQFVVVEIISDRRQGFWSGW